MRAQASSGHEPRERQRRRVVARKGAVDGHVAVELRLGVLVAAGGLNAPGHGRGPEQGYNTLDWHADRSHSSYIPDATIFAVLEIWVDLPHPFL